MTFSTKCLTYLTFHKTFSSIKTFQLPDVFPTKSIKNIFLLINNYRIECLLIPISYMLKRSLPSSHYTKVETKVTKKKKKLIFMFCDLFIQRLCYSLHSFAKHSLYYTNCSSVGLYTVHYDIETKNTFQRGMNDDCLL